MNVQCVCVSIERGLGSGVPDVLAVTPTRYLIEVEIKQTMSDFRKDKEKYCRKLNECDRRYITTDRRALQSYYFVPNALTEKAKAELPQGWGLISMPGKGDHGIVTYSGIYKPIVRVKAPSDKTATPLAPANFDAMVKHQSGTIWMLLAAVTDFVDRHVELKQRRKWISPVNESLLREIEKRYGAVAMTLAIEKLGEQAKQEAKKRI